MVLQPSLQYMAGLIDGEACIYISFSRPGSGIFSIRIAGCFPRSMMDIIQATYGGHVHYKPRRQDHHRDQWSWDIHGKEAICFLEQVRPYLILKGEEADTFIEAWNKAVIPYWFKHGKNLERDKILRPYYEYLKLLKRRNYGETVQ